MGMGAGKGTILPSPATRTAHTYLYNMISNLFSYLSLNINLKTT